MSTETTPAPLTEHKAIVLSPAPSLQPAKLFTPTPKAAKRVLEFFTAQINNEHTRKAYLNATRRFAEWCDARGIAQLADVEAFHVAAFVKEMQGEFSAPTVKQHLAALRARGRAARSRPRSRSPITSRPGRRSFTIGGAMRFHSMKWRRFRSKTGE